MCWICLLYTSISGLNPAGASVSKTLGHTLSYLPQSPNASLSQHLYYDMPRDGETYEYTVEANAQEQAVQVRFSEYSGKKGITPPAEPVLQIDLSPALDALRMSDIRLSIIPV